MNCYATSFVREPLVEIFSEGTLFAGKEELEQEVIKMGGRLNSINLSRRSEI
jgi:hypothetical protein